MRDAGYANQGKEAGRSGWRTAATVILFLCALPVLIPVMLGAGALMGGILLALAACGFAVIVGVGGCVAAGVVCLAALLFGGVVGSGFGFVMLFSTPASGLAVLGTSLVAAGAGVLGCLLLWQIGRFLVWAVRKLAGWLRLHLFAGKRPKKAAGAGADMQAEHVRQEAMQAESAYGESRSEGMKAEYTEKEEHGDEA